MKKIDRITVIMNLNNRVFEVGELVQAERDIYFKYYDSFLNTGLNISPIKLPLNNEIHKGNSNLFDGLYGVFFDSLPDSWGRLLLDRKLSVKGISPNNIGPLERLAFVGSKGTGALEYYPVIENNEHFVTEIGLDDIYSESQQIISGNDSEILDDLYALGGSSGGARPKVQVLVNEQNADIIYGLNHAQKGFKPWIIKFPASIDKPDIAHIEYAYSLMAKATGIEVAPTRLFRGQRGKYYFGTKRFDRIENDKLHMHSVSGMLHDDHRYSQLDYGHMMDCAFQLEKSVLAYEKVLRLATFNVYCHNRDDHSKNFSFLMDDKGNWRLSPAYDLTFSSSSHGHHSTQVAGESLNPGKKQLLELARIFGLKSGTRIIDEVKEVVGNWKKFAREAGVGKTSENTIDKTIKLLIKN